jgi:HlyD family secretion protein
MKKILLTLFVLALLAAGGAYWWNQRQPPEVSDATFGFETVDRGPMQESVSATGPLQPHELLVVTSEAAGTVLKVRADVNDTVAEGDVLLELDDRRAELKVAEARSGVATASAAVAHADAASFAAKLALDYQRDVARSGSRAALDEAKARLKAAEAGVKVANTKVAEIQTQLQQAQLALDLTRVKVPTTQVADSVAEGQKRRYLVLERKVQRGQLIGPTLPVPLFTLARDLQSMEVHAQVAEGDMGRVKLGQEASFDVPAYSDPPIKFPAKVTQIRPLPTTQQGAVYFTVVLAVSNEKDPETKQWRLLPGMMASVDLITRKSAGDVWRVPTAALNFQLARSFQSRQAQQRVEEFYLNHDLNDWRTLWTWDAQKKQPWPLFVRIGGTNGRGQSGLSDGKYNEVLEWEPGTEPRPGAVLRVITKAPEPRLGLFDRNSIKI